MKMFYHLLSNLVYNKPSGKSKEIRKNVNRMEHMSSWSMLTIWQKHT